MAWDETMQDLTGDTRGRQNVGEVFTASRSWAGALRWYGATVSVTDAEKVTTWVKADEIVAISTFPYRKGDA